MQPCLLPRILFFAQSLGTALLFAASPACTIAADSQATQQLQADTDVPSPLSVADGASALRFTIRLRDLTGRPIAGQTVRLLCDTNDVSISALPPTDANGDSVGTLNSAIPGNKRCQASYQRAAGWIDTGAALQLTFLDTQALAGQVVLRAESDKSQAMADGNDTVQLFVAATGSTGEAMPGVAIALRSTQAADAFVRQPLQTDERGHAQMALRSTLAGCRTVQASIGALTQSLPLCFVAGAPTTAKSSLQADGTAVLANGMAQGQYRITLRDAHDNPVASAPVTLQVQGPVALEQNVQLTTDAAGIASVASEATTTAGLRRVRAASAQVTLDASLLYVAGPADAANTQLSVDSGTRVADGNASFGITATAADAFGNPCAGQAFSVTASPATVAFAPGAILHADANGVLMGSASSLIAQNVRLLLQQAGQPLASADIVFTVGPPDATVSHFTASPNQALAGGNATIAVQLQGRVADNQNRALPGYTVTLTTPEPKDVLLPHGAVSDPNGLFTATLQTARAGRAVALARVGDMVLSAGAQLQAVAPSCPGAITLPLRPGPLFAAPNAAGGGPVQAVHFNADAHADLVLLQTSANANNLLVFGGSAAGLSADILFSADVPGMPMAMAVADFDGDGQLDVAAISQGKQLSVVSPSHAPQSYTLAQNNRDICWGDVNGDGKIDLVVLSEAAASGFTVLRNAGDGTFVNMGFQSRAGILSSCTLLDLNHDGKDDLVLLDAQYTTLETLHNQGDGSFTSISTSSVPLSCPNYSGGLAADFDGDGQLDFAALCRVGQDYPWLNFVLSYLGDGMGNLVGPNKFDAGYTIDRLRAADVDADGNVDLVVVSAMGAVLQMRGLGTGDFGAPIATTIPGLPLDAAIADFNGDGMPDVAYSTPSLSLGIAYATAAGVFPTLPATTRPYDHGGNALGTHRLFATDLNHDGRTDFVRAEWNRDPRIYLAQPDGSFYTYNGGSGNGAAAVAAGDFHGDGNTTLVQGNFYGDNALCLYANSGNGLLAGCTDGAVAYKRWYALTAADINNDGIDDVIGVSDDANLLLSYLSVGDGNFVPGPSIAAAAVVPTAERPYVSVQLADLNNDGTKDLVVGAELGTYTFFNDGQGHFAHAQTLAGPRPTAYPANLAVSIADIDGDGYNDLVAGSPFAQPYIWRNLQNGQFSLHNAPSGAGADMAVFTQLLLDVNNDGHVDMVLAVRGQQRSGLAIQMGRGDATFAAASVYGTTDLQQLAGAQGQADLTPVFAAGSLALQNLFVFRASGCN